MANEPAMTGNMVAGNSSVENIADLLLNKGATATSLYTDPYNTLNRIPPFSGNIVASDSRVYNLVDLLSSINIEQGVITSANVPATNGDSVQDQLDKLTAENKSQEEVIEANYADLIALEKRVKNLTSNDRFEFVSTITPDPTKTFFELSLEADVDYYLDCKFILSTSSSDIIGLFSVDGITYDTNTNYRNRVEEKDTASIEPQVQVTSNAENLQFNLSNPPSGLVDLHIEIIRGNSNFQPFTRATMEYINMEGDMVDLIEQIGGFNQYGCKKFKLAVTDGTFNNLNNVISHIDIYKRV